MYRTAGLGILLLLASTCTAFAAEPLFESVDLFTARQGGYHTYRIPALAVSPPGTILAFCEGRKESERDWGNIDVLCRRSTDDGLTWSEPRLIADAQKRPAHNPAVVVDREGTIHLLYCVNYARAFHVKSTDDGLTFSPPVEITATLEAFKRRFLWNVIATGPGHGIQLRSGRLVVPVWMSNGGKAHRPSGCSVIYSDDLGENWQPGDLVPIEFINMSEAAAVELENAAVLLNIRNEDRDHRRAISVSKDGAYRWTSPKLLPALSDPVCMAGMLRLNFKSANEPGRILFSNPNNPAASGRSAPPGSRIRDRVNLTVRLSLDDGRTWPVSRVLDPGMAGYSDLAADQDGHILCLYERGRVDNVATDPEHLTLARFNLEWLNQAARDDRELVPDSKPR